MRIALVIAIALHAAIHIMGFLKWFKLAELPSMSGSTLLRLSPAAAKAYGVLWLVAFVVLLAAAVALARRDSWWLLGLGGALLSQCLIVFAWPDAKFGTIGNLLIAVALALGAARARLDDGARDGDEARPDAAAAMRSPRPEPRAARAAHPRS